MKFYNTYLTFKENTGLIGYKAILKLLSFLKFTQKYFQLENDINTILKLQFDAKRKDAKTILVKNESTECYLRPYTSDIKVFYQIFKGKEYGYLCDLLENCGLNNSKLNVIDCGSNIGLFGKWLQSEYKIDKIISIEAESSNYHFQLKYNQLVNTHLLNLAVWSNNYETLSISDLFRDGDKWSKSVERIDRKNKSKKVKTTTLNELYFKYFNNSQIDILKIDVEGAEKEIFQHENSFDIALKHTKIIAIEIHEEFVSQKEILTLLEKAGFDIIYFNQTFFGINTKYKKHNEKK